MLHLELKLYFDLNTYIPELSLEQLQ